MNNNLIFPINIPPYWHNIQQLSVPDPYLKNWLLDTSSLTERLQSLCQKFTLHLIGQRQMSPELEEIARLKCGPESKAGELWQIREVLLSGNGKPWVFARSILPQVLCEQDLAGLGEKPLGQIIFNDPRFARQPFQLTCLKYPSELHRQFNLSNDSELWGRRSVFQFQTHQLMVAEIFLPDSPAYRQMEQGARHD